jgi:exodeoxyribonuclease VII large subunit
MDRAWATRIERERLLLAGMRNALDAQSPLAVLSRGYCVAEKDGAIVKGVALIHKEDRLKIRFYDGTSRVIVERVDHD